MRKWLQALTASMFFLTSGVVVLGEPSSEGASQSEQEDKKKQSSEASEMTVETVPLQSATFEEVKPMLEPLLSEAGKLRFFSSRHAVMIYDTRETVKKIEQRLEKIDRKPVNIRISVSFDETSRESGGSLEAKTGVLMRKDGETEIRGNVGVRGGVRQRTTRSKSSQFVITRNNRPAEIWVGKSVPRERWVFEYGLDNGWWQRDIVYDDIGASLLAHPRMIGEDRVRVYVYPKLTVEGKQELSVKARELATQVVVPDGGTVQLGGLEREKREAYKHLFGVGKVFNGRSLEITLNVQVMRK